MTTKKTSRRALFTSVMALVMCLVMLVGTTFAWFTDSVTSGVNTIKSGNLDVELEYKNTKDGTFAPVNSDTEVFKNGALWEPGHVEYVVLKIRNAGSLALKYKLAVNVANEVAGKTADDVDILLSKYLQFKVLDGDKSNLSRQEMLDAEGRGGSLEAKVEDAVALYSANSGSTPSEKTVTLVVWMPTTVGNEANHGTGKAQPSIDLGVAVYATQVEHEEDSFGPDYDAGVNFTTVTTEEGFRAAVAAGNPVILNNTLELTEDLVIDKDIVINGNGNALITDKPVHIGSNVNVTITNVSFKDPTNGRGNASNLYASGLEGKLVLNNCTFGGTQWDCVQVTPKEGAEIVINACRFEADTDCQRFIHIQAADFSNADVKVTLTNNFFGASDHIQNALIDLDYINLAGINFGGNNVYVDTEADIYVCGPSAGRTISKEDAYKALGSLKAVDGSTVTEITGNVTIAKGETVSVNSSTTIEAGSTISGAGVDKSTMNVNKSTVSSDNVTIKDVTIKGSGSAGTGGTLNINGSNTTIENVNYEGDGNIAITVSTNASNTGTVFKNTRITNAFRGIQFWSLSGDSRIENCVLDVAGYTFNIDAAVAGSTLTIKDSTLNGWTSYTSGIKKVTFDNCSLGLNAYAYLRPYSETELIGCQFTYAGYQLSAGGSDAYTITLTSCTKNGTPITADNVKTLLLDTDDWNANATLIVNGVTVTVN